MIKTILLCCLLAMLTITANSQSGDRKPVVIDSAEQEEPMMFCQQMPVYPGGEPALKEFIATQMVYPQSAIDKKKQGKVYVSYIIEKDGTTSNHKVNRGVEGAKELDDEALRIAKLITGYFPGKHNGQLVRLTMHFPIEFTLPGKEKK